MRTTDQPHLSIPLKSSEQILQEKEDEYEHLKKAHELLTEYVEKLDHDIPEVTEKLDALGKKLKELRNILDDYKKFLEKHADILK